MTPYWDELDTVAEFVAWNIPGPERFGEHRGLGVLDRDGCLVAGVVFFNYAPHRGLVEMACASIDRRWMTRTVMRAAWGYAFGIARMAYAKTSERNSPVRRIWKACGASEVLVPDMWGEGEAMSLLTLTEPQWRASRFGRTE